MSDSTRETCVEQGPKSCLTKISGQVTLLRPPQNRGGVKLPNARRYHGSAKRVPAQPWEDKGIRLAIEHRVDVPRLDAAPGQFGAVVRFGHVRFGAKQVRGLDHRLLEGQILERVQCVVVDENPDRTLHRKQVRRMINRTAQPIFSRSHRAIGLVQAVTAQRGLARVRSCPTIDGCFCKRSNRKSFNINLTRDS
jgi:hypothetical protein